jgi:hypothetical protein
VLFLIKKKHFLSFIMFVGLPYCNATHEPVETVKTMYCNGTH